MPKSNLYLFAKESNEIEGIKTAKAHQIHAEALEEFLKETHLTVPILERFVKKIQPNARLRTLATDRVRVGNHIPPVPPVCIVQLEELLKEINDFKFSDESPDKFAWHAHNQYETIHPFMDGNGRSGRAIWLWFMRAEFNWNFQLSFLHMYYYQTLANTQVRYGPEH